MGYFGRSLLLLFEMFVVLAAFLGLSAAFSGRSLAEVFRDLAEGRSPSAPVIFWMIEIAYQILFLRLVVMRLHDIGVRGWWGAIAICVLTAAREIAPPESAMQQGVELVGLVLGLLVLFWPGAKGPNRFGADPRPPTMRAV